MGIDVASYPSYVDKKLYSSNGLSPHIFFDKEPFGADKLVINPMDIGLSETGDKPRAGAERF